MGIYVHKHQISQKEEEVSVQALVLYLCSRQPGLEEESWAPGKGSSSHLVSCL